MSCAHRVSRSLFVSIALCVPTLASAGTLNLSPGGTIDISGLNIQTVGDMILVDQRIWISDGTNDGILYAIVTATGLLHQTVDPAIVPGFTKGADAIASVGVADLFVFSSFGESAAGRINQNGSLESAFPSAEQATGAAFGQGGLWIASGTTVGAGSTLKRLDTSTGAVLQTVPIPGLTARIVDISFDGFSGSLYALCEDDQLREIDTVTGAIVSTQDLAPLLIGHLSVAGGIAFDASGSHLYVANGTGAGSDSIVILNRSFSVNLCGSQLGTFACPCANDGATGRGCRNSTSFNLGAFLASTGLPDVSADTFVLQAGGLPPGTFVLFFQGTSLVEPAVAFGDGALCVGGSVVRLGIEAAPSGTASYPGAGEPLIHVQGQLPATNSIRVYQGWYRDSATFCTPSVFNLTNGIRADWRP